MNQRGRPTKGQKILVIGDDHARKGVSHRRYIALGRFIVDKRPDHVVWIGDHTDNPATSRYDVGTVVGEGGRYKDDVKAGNDSLDLVHKELRGMKGKPYFHITLGNHDIRPDSAAAADPKLYGTIGLHDIHYKKYGYNIVPFLKPLIIQNIAFQHYFTSGVMGRAIGGENHARTMVLKNHMSSVCGHSHTKDFWETVTGAKKKIFGLVAGCYDEGHHHYTTEQSRWWSGLTMLHEARDGYAEPAFYSIKYILGKYL